MNNSQVQQSSGTMPAQWERHWGTLMAFPFDNELWFGKLSEVRREYSALVQEIAKHEKVLLVLPPDEWKQIAAGPLGKIHNLHLFPFSLNDAWVRDSGPIFLRPTNSASSACAKGGTDAQFFALDFIFNAWGNKFAADLDDKLAHAISKLLGVHSQREPFVFEGGSLDVNGAGSALTTRQCLLEKQRNPNCSEADIESYLKKKFELDELVWLGDGLKGDHTDGHIDTIARFVNKETVVCHIAKDRAHPSFDALQMNFEYLAGLAASGKSAIKKVVPLPVPKKVFEFEGELVPYSYANFYFSNSGVIVPQFQDEHDSIVLNILQEICPDKAVVGLAASHIVLGGGVFNCLTQQIPLGAVPADWKPNA